MTTIKLTEEEYNDLLPVSEKYRSLYILGPYFYLLNSSGTMLVLTKEELPEDIKNHLFND